MNAASQPNLPVLTPEFLEEVAKKELANALQKLSSGGSLTKYEREIIQAAGDRGKSSGPSSVTAPEHPPGLALAATWPHVLSRAGIQLLFPDPVTGKPLTTRTIDRINHIAGLADVGTPAPWHDPAALAAWYQTYYRSDPGKPAPAKARALPPWLSHALNSRPPSPPPSVEPAPDPAAALPEIPPDLPPMSALAFARQIERDAQRKYLTVQQDTTKEPAARRAYLDTLERVQLAEERAKKAGVSDDLPRETVARHLDTLHSRIIRTFIRDLTHARTDAMRASSSPDQWSAWVKSKINDICRGMTATGFTDPNDDPGEAAAA